MIFIPVTRKYRWREWESFIPVTMVAGVGNIPSRHLYILRIYPFRERECAGTHPNVWGDMGTPHTREPTQHSRAGK